MLVETLEDRQLMSVAPSVPVFSSLPGAPATLYLDFDGHYEATWGSYSDVTTPVYDFDSDLTSFSSDEVASIELTWKVVAEDFAPFHINVTTVEPPELATGVPESEANGKAMRVAIGGKGTDWYGSNVGGVGYINSFTNSNTNVVYVFAGGVSNGLAIGNTSSHEAGHSLGARHQSEYRSDGTRLEYGYGNGITAPIMGMNLYETTRPDVWYIGPTSTITTIQDDMAVIASSTNGFGYRPDDYPQTTDLSPSGDEWSANGIVSQTSDIDSFSFSLTAADTYRLFADVAEVAAHTLTGDVGANLDIVMDLSNAAGQVIASINPATAVTAELVRYLEVGSYHVSIKSTGEYGRVGQYSFKIERPEDGLVVKAAPVLTTSERGQTATISVALRTQPSSTVVVPINLSSSTEVIAEPAALTFTAQNWDIPQTVLLSGLSDGLIDADIASTVTLGPMDGYASTTEQLTTINLDADGAASYLFADAVTDTIYRVRQDGSGIDAVLDLRLITGGTTASIASIALDPAVGKIYWVNSTSKTIQRSNIDGSNIESVYTPTTADYTPRSIVIDAARRELLWCDFTNTTGMDSYIRRMPIDGGTIAYVGSPQKAWFLNVDPETGAVYTHDSSLRTLSRMDRDGQNFQTLLAGIEVGNAGQFYIASELTGAENRIYWADALSDRIRSVAMDGTDLRTIIDIRNFLGAEANIKTLNVDAATRTMTWGELGTGFYYRSQLDGANTVRIHRTQSVGPILSATAISTPKINISQRSGLKTNENGQSAEFYVSLATRPTANVTIPLSSLDSSEGVPNVASLTFTPDNWQFDQKVSILGVDDALRDADISYQILVGDATSDDPAYSNLSGGTVSLTNADDDQFTKSYLIAPWLNIVDRGTITSTLEVPDAGSILDLNVLVNLTHGWNSDLDVYLIAPDGTRVMLFTDVGGSSQNFTKTVLDAEATTSITAGTAPYTGTFRPEGDLKTLIGKNLSGTWKLEVRDDSNGVVGQLINWSITAHYAAPAPGVVVSPTSGLQTSEGGGTASFTVSLSARPTADVTIPVSSSDSTEGAVSISSLVFTPDNWNAPQTVTVRGIDDTLTDGDVTYAVVLGIVSSTDSRYNGLDPSDVAAINRDNDVPQTGFFVLNDSTDRTYEYTASGTAIENYAIDSYNSQPRGAATDGSTVWVADKSRKVFVYNTAGALQGSWTAGTLSNKAQVEGIGSVGGDIWIVDGNADRVYRYNAAATLTSGSQNANSYFALNRGNLNPKGLHTDGYHIWVVQDNSSGDRVFKYTVGGSLVGSWVIDAANKTPTGLTIDAAGDVWIVDSGTDRIYRYAAAADRSSESLNAASFIQLAGDNSNPQGIAAPPAVTGVASASPFDGASPSSPSVAPEDDRSSNDPLKRAVSVLRSIFSPPEDDHDHDHDHDDSTAELPRGIATAVDRALAAWDFEVFGSGLVDDLAQRLRHQA